MIDLFTDNWDHPPILQEGERLVRVITGNREDEVYAILPDGLDDVDSELQFALTRRYGRANARYEGYEESAVHSIGTSKKEQSMKVYNTDTGKVVELSCIVDGINILADVMGGYGVDTVQPFDDTEWLFALPGEEIEWWAAWAEREERIQSALEEADETTRAACYEACDSDLEASQDRVAHILGIDQSDGDRPSLSSEAKTAKEAALALAHDTGTEAEREQAIE